MINCPQGLLTDEVGIRSLEDQVNRVPEGIGTVGDASAFIDCDVLSVTEFILDGTGLRYGVSSTGLSMYTGTVLLGTLQRVCTNSAVVLICSNDHIGVLILCVSGTVVFESGS